MSAAARLALALLLSAGPMLGAQNSVGRDLAQDLDRLAAGEHVPDLPPAAQVAPGARRIQAGTIVHGAVVARGPVVVDGTVDGAVVALGGNVTVRRGGIVRGDAIAVGGTVVADSGEVDGEMRSMSALAAVRPTSDRPGSVETPLQRTVDAVRIVAGTFGVLLIVAVGVLLFAGPNLDEVVVTLEQRFGRAFLAGVVGQLLILPVLLLLLVALALTIVGILLLPFAIVAYAVLVAGLVTLGFLAVARLVGGVIWRSGSDGARRRALGGLAIGVAVFFAIWCIAALLTWAPHAATIVPAAALAATWAAMTVGLGAAIVSRGGTHRRVASVGRQAELASWQTPTPITGVVAARRRPAAATGELR